MPKTTRRIRGDSTSLMISEGSRLSCHKRGSLVSPVLFRRPVTTVWAVVAANSPTASWQEHSSLP